MRKLLSIIVKHLRQDFQFKYYFGVSLFLAISLFLNYSLNLENGWIDQHAGYAQVILYFLLYGIGYYTACGLVFSFNHLEHVWKSKKFWHFSLVGLLILAHDKCSPFLTEIMNALHQPYEIYVWLFRVAANISSFFLVLLPLILFYQLADKKKSNLYGLTLWGDCKPYLYLLLLVTPFIFIASLQHDFTTYYPVYKSNQVAEIWNWPYYLPMIIFEFFYGADFLNVEFLFRGFFVIGMSQILGRHAVLPMVSIYCFLHFGKPVGEAISSIIGGYILGVIALNTRSIWGGILIHIGVAWLMEMAAYISKQL